MFSDLLQLVVVVGVYGVLLCVLDLLQLAMVVGVYGELLCVLDLLQLAVVVGVYRVLLCVFRPVAWLWVYMECCCVF